MPPIPSGGLARTPTALIHGRHGLRVRLPTAREAGARCGRPVHVTEECRDAPPWSGRRRS